VLPAVVGGLLGVLHIRWVGGGRRGGGGCGVGCVGQWMGMQARVVEWVECLCLHEWVGVDAAAMERGWRGCWESTAHIGYGC
jgi:hypothetical protein